MPQKKQLPWSMVTVAGVIIGHIGISQDGIVRFSVKNRNGRFYTVCHLDDLQNVDYLQPDRQVIVTGSLISFFNKESQRHQTAIRATSISVTEDGQMLSIWQEPDQRGQ